MSSFQRCHATRIAETLTGLRLRCDIPRPDQSRHLQVARYAERRLDDLFNHSLYASLKRALFQPSPTAAASAQCMDFSKETAMTNTSKTEADDLAIPAFLKRDARKNPTTAKKPTIVATKPEKSTIPQAMAPEAVKAVVASRAKAVKAGKAAKLATTAATAPKAAAKKAAAPKPATLKAEKKPKELDPKVVELIALLKTKKGATNEEAAKALKLKAKGEAPHQSASAQVRAMVRDKVRKLHDVKAEHDGERGGVVFRIA